MPREDSKGDGARQVTQKLDKVKLVEVEGSSPVIIGCDTQARVPGDSSKMLLGWLLKYWEEQ